MFVEQNVTHRSKKKNVTEVTENVTEVAKKNFADENRAYSDKIIYGLSWQNIDLIGHVSSFLAVIDPNSFGLVSSSLYMSYLNK